MKCQDGTKRWGQHEKMAAVGNGGNSMKSWQPYEKVSTVWKGVKSMKDRENLINK